jgi:hypothetical protein
VAKDAGEIVIGGRPAVTEPELIARIEELEAHLAISRKWLEELSDLKARLAELEGES